MDLSDADGQAQLMLALIGLVDQGLIGADFALRVHSLRRGSQELQDDTLLVCPNERGASLFLRALGLRGLHPEVITSLIPDPASLPS